MKVSVWFIFLSKKLFSNSYLKCEYYWLPHELYNTSLTYPHCYGLSLMGQGWVELSVDQLCKKAAAYISAAIPEKQWQVTLLVASLWVLLCSNAWDLRFFNLIFSVLSRGRFSMRNNIRLVGEKLSRVIILSVL